MSQEFIKNQLAFLARRANKKLTSDAPQASLPNANQHLDNIDSSTSEYRPNLTPSASGFSFGGPSASGQSGFGAGPSFGGSRASGQSSLTPNGGPSFGGSAASGQSGFGAGPSFGGSAASGQSGFGAGSSFGGSAASGQSGFGAGSSFGGSAASGQSGFGAAPNPPPPTSNHGLCSISSFRKLWASQENNTDAEPIDLTDEGESKIGGKRKSEENGEEGSEKKIKQSDDLPQLGGKGLFQYVYMFFKKSTGVKKTSPEANERWDKVRARRTYFEKLAQSFKADNTKNGVKRGASFEKKRDALAKRLSEIAGMCTEEEDEWKAPKEPPESLFN